MLREEALLAEHLAIKNDSHTFVQNLQSRYALPVATAETLHREILTFFRDSSYLEDGEEFFTAIDISEPAGKPLKQCKTRRIRLTVRCRNDLEIRAREGVKGYYANAISRLCWQALEQRTLLTQEDLAFLLNTSRATIKRILKELKRQGEYIPTRGNYHDIGPGLSHKYQAVRLYIKGMEPTDISARLGHSLGAIERYIEDFSLVVAASMEDYNAFAISRFTRISEKVVREYLVLYDRFALDPPLRPFLDALIKDFKERQLLKKTIDCKQ